MARMVLVATAVLCGVLFSPMAMAEIKLDLVGPDSSVKPGRMVICKLTGNAERVEWAVCGLEAGDWLAVPQEDGSRVLIVVCPAAGRYRVTVVGCRADLDANGKPIAEMAIASTTIVCGDVKPPPDPQPEPDDPQPEPDIPEDKALQASIAKVVSGLTAEAKKQAEGAAMAYELGADEIESGDITSVAILNNTTWRRLYAATDRKLWAPFDTAVREELPRLAEAGLIVTIEHHEMAWRRIAAGIRDGAGQKARRR